MPTDDDRPDAAASVDDDDQADDDEDVVEWIELEAQQRLWVRVLLPVATLATPDRDDPCRKAVVLARNAACDRIARICRRDVVAGERDD